MKEKGRSVLIQINPWDVKVCVAKRRKLKHALLSLLKPQPLVTADSFTISLLPVICFTLTNIKLNVSY